MEIRVEGLDRVLSDAGSKGRPASTKGQASRNQGLRTRPELPGLRLYSDRLLDSLLERYRKAEEWSKVAEILHEKDRRKLLTSG